MNKKRKTVFFQHFQWGMTAISPMLLLLFTSIWIHTYWKVGTWVIVLAIFLGAISIFYQLYLLYRKYSKGEIKQRNSYNQHR